MKNYYIDPSASAAGDGGINSPFNSLDILATLTPEFPFTIAVKRGSVSRGNWDYRSLRNLVSTSSERSFITAYGEGSRPVIIQRDGEQVALGLTLHNTIVSEINPMTNDISQNQRLVHLYAAPDITGNGLVEIQYCHGESHPKCAVVAGKTAFMIQALPGIKQASNFLRIAYCTGKRVSEGAHILGNSLFPDDADPLDNSTDGFKTRGAVIEYCSFVETMGNGYILNQSVSTVENWDVSDSETSRISFCFNSGYRWDAFSGATDRKWYAGFWFVRSKRCVIEYCECAGMWPYGSDCCPFDFDIQSWSCKVRYCYSHSNAGGFLLCISTAADANKANQGSYSDREWLVDRQWGQGNNIIEYCLSFNDGVSRNASIQNAGWIHKFNVQGYSYNNIARNITMIDTVSREKQNLCYQTLLWETSGAGGAPALLVDSCVIYYKNLMSADFVASNGGTNTAAYRSMFRMKNSSLFSLALGAGGIPVNTENDAGGNTTADPQFEFVPDSPPDNMDAAKWIKFQKLSALWNAGSENSLPDILGNHGNAVGWLQKGAA